MRKYPVDPYLPSASVSEVLISSNASQKILKSLFLHGIFPVPVDPVGTLPSYLSSHADMQLVNVCKGVFVHAPGISPRLTKYLNESGFQLIKGNTDLKSVYPYDTAYNCAIADKYAFLNVKAADAVLLEVLRKCGKKLIHVNQGYAKCSVCLVNKEAVITADTAIHKWAVATGLDSLLIPPQRNIVLEGCDYGFIGGAAGLISERELAFSGSFENLDSRDDIARFLEKHGIVPVSRTWAV
mgnify:CR=1 FL=1